MAAARAVAAGVELERAVTVDAVREQLRALGHSDDAVPDTLIASFLKDIFAEVKAEAGATPRASGAKSRHGGREHGGREQPPPPPARRTGSLPRGGRLAATPPPDTDDEERFLPPPRDALAALAGNEGGDATRDALYPLRARAPPPPAAAGDSCEASCEASFEEQDDEDEDEGDYDDAVAPLAYPTALPDADAVPEPESAPVAAAGRPRPRSASDFFAPARQAGRPAPSSQSEPPSLSAAFGRLMVPNAAEADDGGELTLEDQPLRALVATPPTASREASYTTARQAATPSTASARSASSARSTPSSSARRYNLGAARRVLTPQSGMRALVVDDEAPDSPAPPAVAPSRPPGFTPERSADARTAAPYRSPYAQRVRAAPRVRPASARPMIEAAVQHSPSAASAAASMALVPAADDAAPVSPSRPLSARPASARARTDRVSAYAAHVAEWGSRRTTLGSVARAKPRRQQNFFQKFAAAHKAEERKQKARRRAVREATVESLRDTRVPGLAATARTDARGQRYWK